MAPVPEKKAINIPPTEISEEAQKGISIEVNQEVNYLLGIDKFDKSGKEVYKEVMKLPAVKEASKELVDAVRTRIGNEYAGTVRGSNKEVRANPTPLEKELYDKEEAARIKLEKAIDSNTTGMDPAIKSAIKKIATMDAQLNGGAQANAFDKKMSGLGTTTLDALASRSETTGPAGAAAKNTALAQDKTQDNGANL